MSHNRHRAGIRRLITPPAVPRSKRVGPVERLINRQKVREAIAGARVPEVVDPFYLDRPVVGRLDGQGWEVKNTRGVGRAVAPDRSQGRAGRQNLLLELPY